jgi:YkoY family integral membrane protein
MGVRMHGSDVLTVGLLVVLEAMLSADNALVMAIIVLGLPRDQQRKALRQGLGGAFVSRVLATVLAVKLIALVWVKLVGGLYLLYLAYDHFSERGGESETAKAPAARPIFGLSPYWSTVVRLELLNLMFSIDSILVAVAMSNNVWVVMAGGVIGLLAMRFIAAQLLRLVERYPPLVDGAFVIIAWVGIELILEYLHATGRIALEVPRPASLGLIVVIFAVSYLYARLKGPVDAES